MDNAQLERAVRRLENEVTALRRRIVKLEELTAPPPPPSESETP